MEWGPLDVALKKHIWFKSGATGKNLLTQNQSRGLDHVMRDHIAPSPATLSFLMLLKT